MINLRILVGTVGLLAAFVLPAGGAAAPFEAVSTFTYSQNMHPLGFSPRANTPEPAFTANSDLAFWGHLAYHGNYDGFRIVDVSAPTNPRELNDYRDCAGNQGDVIVWNTLLIRSWNSPAAAGATCDGEPVPPSTLDANGWEGLHVFDVSIPLDNPAAAHYLRFEPAGRSCHDGSVILGDTMLAACAGTISGQPGFTVWSIGGSRGGSLEDPEQLFSINVTGTTTGHSVAFSWDGKVLIFGSEPGGGSQPRCTPTGTVFPNGTVQTDEMKSLFFFSTADGSFLGKWTLPRDQTLTENCTIHNYNVVPTKRGRVLVSGNYQSGLAVVDFTDPAHASEIAYADPAPLDPNTLELGGDWSSYWYDGRIYESDITRGLLIWDLSDPAVGGALKLGHLNPQTQEFTLG